ncbi:MAG TPA: PASTA domain-containing protein [Terriglobales bacterium]|nr:PASTA domain-containing protein [Terriglobales bacterium]
MKAFFRLVLLALILLVVALLSALTAMRFAIHTREVAVPDLVGKTPAEARRIAELNGFQFEVERQYYSPKIPEGKILSQLPPAGTQIRRGWQIRVAESLGPQRVEIPDVIGQSERAAEINILRRGLDVGAVAQVQFAGVPPDQVIAQSPSPSASSISAPKISLLAAQAPPLEAFVIPSFIGQTVSAASATLKAAGLRVGNVTMTASVPNTTSQTASSPASEQPSPSSTIVAQNPAPGNKVVAGASVDFEVR